VPLTARRSALRSLLAVVGVFTLSRIGYYIAGVRFDVSSLPWFWQFVDPALLKANLGQSLWYLHSQPPAFNLFLGVVVNLFPGHETLAFTTCYILLGLVFAVTLFLLLRGFGVPDALSAAATSVYVASPTCVLYESWLFYTHPLTVLLLLAALFWQRFTARGRYLDALLLFGCGAMLALTWSLFHLVWLLGSVLVLMLFRRKDWRKVLAAAAIPLFVVAFWYGKNLVQFGQFTGSTWFGMNFSRMANAAVTRPERQALYDRGAISAVSFIRPFRAPDNYHEMVPMPPPTGIPVLDQEMKPSGVPNFNNSIFIALSRQYGRDAFKIVAAYPTAYLRSLIESYRRYFRPSSMYSYLDGNAAHIGVLVRAQRLLNAGWLLALGYAVVSVVGIAMLFRHSLFSAHRLSLLFLWFNIMWVTLAANAIEVGENNRFRFVADPLVLTFLVAVAAVSRIRAIRRRDCR
jgi:hypothetical protein